jgi:hypothetical protein
MLALDGKIINFRDKDSNRKLKDPIARFVKDKMDDIGRDYKFPVKVVLDESAGYKPDPYKRPKYIKYPTYGVPMTTKISAITPGEVGVETWTYYETSKTLNSGKVVYSPRRMMVNGKVVIDESKLDLLFFLLYCSPMVENSSNDKLRELKKVKKPISVDNPAKKAVDYVNKNKFRVKAEYLLLGDDGISQEIVNKTAKYFSIKDVNNRGDYEVRKALIDKIGRLDSWEELLDVINDYGRDDNRSDEDIKDIIVMIQDGYDSGVLYEKNLMGKNSIMVKGSNDEKGTRIMVIADESKKIEDFASYLKDNADVLSQITKKIKD